MRELRCPACRKFLARASDDFTGTVGAVCPRCLYDLQWLCVQGEINVIATPRPDLEDDRRVRRAAAPESKQAKRDRELVEKVEEVWALRRVDRAMRSVDMAVGLRFDVFNRDGFRCVYCGRGPADGVQMHADHVVPRAKGGQDVLSNLVTACWDCNLGKSDKPLFSSLDNESPAA